MEPVEIEFLMRDKLTPGIEEITKTTDDLGQKVEQVSAGIKKQIGEQKGEINRVEGDLQSLEKQYAKLAPGAAQAEMKAEIIACKKCLDEEKVSLQGLEAEYEKNKVSAKRLSAELRETQETLARMRIEGRQATPAYEELSQKADVLKETLGDLQTQTKGLTHDSAGFQGLVSGASGLVGVFTVATGVMGVFAAENESLQKIQARVQSVLGITIGLQQVYNALNKDSAFRLVTVARAKTLLATATGNLSTALGISNIAAKALMATLTLGLSVAIGAVIYLWDRFSSSQSAAREDLKKFNDSVAETSSKSITGFSQLQQQWNALGDALEAKEEFIRKNQEAFQNLGAAINNVKDAENLLVDNAPAFLESIKLKAQAAAAMELASDKYQESVKKMLEAEAMPDKKTVYMGGGNLAPGTSITTDNANKTSTQAKANSLRAEGDALIDRAINYENNAIQTLRDANIKSNNEIVAGSVAAIEASVETKRKALKKLTNKQDYTVALAEIAAEEQKLKAITGVKEYKTLPPAPVNNLAETELKVRQRIELDALAIQKEGYEKQKEAAQLHRKQEMDRINQEETERLALLAKLKASGAKVAPGAETTIKGQAGVQRIQATALLDKQLTDINAKQKKEQTDQYTQLLEPYRTYAEQRLAIEKKFADDKKKLQEGGASPENMVIADEQETTVLDELDTTFASKEASFQVLLSRITSMSLSELEKTLKQAQSSLQETEQKDGKNSQAAGIQRAKINAISQKLKYAQAEAEADDDDGKDNSKKWDRTSKALKKCKEEIDGMIGSMDFLDESTRTALQTASNIAGGTISMINSIKSLGVGAAESLSAVEKASVILAIIGAAVQIITAIFSMASASEARHQKALAEIASAKIAMQREYNLLIMEQNLLFEQGKTIFGEQEILKAINAVENYRHAIASYKEEMKGTAPEANSWERLTNDAFGTYAKRLEAYQKGIYALSSLEIITGHKKTGLFGWGKGKDVYSSVLEVYPDLIEGENRLNVERAKAILDTQKMSDENKKLLQYLIDLQNQADKATEELRDFLEDTFGDLGSGAIDAITDSIKNGTDMFTNFGKTGAAVLEQLGEKAAYSLFFARYFQKLQDDLEKIYGSGKGEEGIARDSMNLIGSFFSSIGGQMDAAKGWLEQWKEEANKQGFDLWADEDTDASQSAKSGAFTTMTQEQGSKLEGLFTAVQMHTSSIDGKMDDLAEQTYKAFAPLAAIAENTSHCKRLKEIEGILSEIKRDGIKVK